MKNDAELATLPAAPHDVAVGERIRALRKRRRVSLAELAAATGRSTGYLSQLERGLSSPTLRELAIFASVLDTDFMDLLAEPATESAQDSPVRAHRDQTLIPFRGSGVTKRVLAPKNRGSIQFYVMRIDPGGSSGEQPYSHDGEEAGYLLRGAMVLTVDKHTYEVRQGDSFRFASSRPHSFRNPGTETAEVLWINVGSNGIPPIA